jgi:hypothetical protein
MRHARAIFLGEKIRRTTRNTEDLQSRQIGGLANTKDNEKGEVETESETKIINK